MADTGRDAVEAFIGKWQGVTASELSTSQSFLSDLCGLLGVDSPHPTPEQDYMFERPITFAHGDGSTSAGRIDLYKRGAFILESKKLKAASHTRGFDEALLRARSQAEGYARALPASEGRPPFVVVVDVGNRIELYSEFSRSGATYTPFPDPGSHRIALAELRDPRILDRLRRVWTDPLGLDPSRESARVTREIAERLATLARSLEGSRHTPEAVAQFLMRCLFTMFAEDVTLLPHDSFRDLLVKYAEQPDVAMRMLGQLWRDMDSGGFSAAIASDVLRFNGKLFKQPDTLPLDRAQIDLLIEAARAKWEHVEPAIFGTLLERALTPGERHKLGAHYTPRAYVERLVLPTVIEPLRAEWSDALAAALVKAAEAKDIEEEIRSLPARAKEEKGLKERLRDASSQSLSILRAFHHRLCTVRVLDPACGSGNFLYVTLEHLKRLEGEVLNALDELGYRQTGLALGGERADAVAGETVDPHNLLGIELNPRAAAIAEVVLWIGYLQWHFRTRGDVSPPIPVIRDFKNIENRDAVLAYDRVEYVTDERGIPVTRWDGETMKVSPVTGEQIPDDAARKPVERYVNPRGAAWPPADFVVGNPPFIGNKRMRTALGDGYVEALRGAWPDVPESTDFVMYWWHHAALMTRRGALQRFGLITTNSIHQTFNRRVLEPHLTDIKHPLSLLFAIPDHPWVDSGEGAAVRIAMTVGGAGSVSGTLGEVIQEEIGADDSADVSLELKKGRISADLAIGRSKSNLRTLRANRGLSFMGVILVGDGFFIDDAADQSLIDRMTADGVISEFVSGTDLQKRPRGRLVVDFTGLSEKEARECSPTGYQWLLDRVKPSRLENQAKTFRDVWWQFGAPRPVMRRAVSRLRRYIVTGRTAKVRAFQFLAHGSVVESNAVVIASSDAADLGVLSSTPHVVWASWTGATLEDRPHYTNSTVFESFPFPSEMEEQRESIRTLAEHLDAHRKRQQAAHADLTLTGMYNVLDKLRSGEALTAKERTTHDHGLVSVLRQLHDELDAAVLDAYGWSDLLPLLRIAHGNDAPDGQSRDEAKRAFDDAILERLVVLNAERAAEETRGLIRWLRPDFQNPTAQVAPTQTELATDSDDTGASSVTAATKPIPWPTDAIAQVRAVADVLSASPVALSIDQIAARFTARGAWKKRLPQLLEMLVALGRATANDGKYGT